MSELTARRAALRCTSVLNAVLLLLLLRLFVVLFGVILRIAPWVGHLNGLPGNHVPLSRVGVLLCV